MVDIVGGETLASLWDKLARKCGEKDFFIFQGRDGGVETFTYRQFNEKINQTANMFLREGVAFGERVAVQMHTCPEFLMCLFGLAKIGAVTVPMNEQYLQAECEYALDMCEIERAVVEPCYVELYDQICADGRLPKGISVARTLDPQETCGHRIFSELVDAESTELAEQRALTPDDVCEILFTSGTTSNPKGVLLTHGNMVYSGYYGDWETSMTASDRMLTTMPACHSNFQLAALTPVLTARATMIVVEKYSASRFWSQVREYRATLAQCVAMMLRTLMLQPTDPAERDHSLRDMLYFLPVSAREKKAFEERFGVRILNTYGSTESIGWVLTDPPTGERKWPSIGRVGLGYEAKIIDENGNELPANRVGEICVKGVPGRSLMLGYVGNEKATAEALTSDGWLHMGDKGYYDEEGWFFFVDRKSNMIKRAGENISTTEIEEILTEHPAVKEAAVIGVPDDIRDEAVKAFILPEDGARIDEEEIVEYCRNNMAAFKVPSFIEVVDDFPRTCSMKIEKRLLR
ncbi:crotonobetaine/carnitine-CoA ligase [uncultured Ellagibacter sp.]|uniref:crotonobetaine/carnitine-CoA ligase n=1 Tax=uncultured Ellagibacter sp. TaxID=2137580 RepID=UPI0026242A2D|nr:crotonobetaine/carnitine-CoA ligase [uncultured Ellagibacter sp.]